VGGGKHKKRSVTDTTFLIRVVGMKRLVYLPLSSLGSRFSVWQ